MRFSRRVVRTAALIRDRRCWSSEVGDTRASPAHPEFSLRHAIQVCGADPPKSIRDPHRPVSGTALVPNDPWHIVVLRILCGSPPACFSHGTLFNRRVT